MWTPSPRCGGATDHDGLPRICWRDRHMHHHGMRRRRRGVQRDNRRPRDRGPGPSHACTGPGPGPGKPPAVAGRLVRLAKPLAPVVSDPQPLLVPESPQQSLLPIGAAISVTYAATRGTACSRLCDESNDRALCGLLLARCGGGECSGCTDCCCSERDRLCAVPPGIPWAPR